MALIYSQSIILPLLITLLFLGGLVSAYPAPMQHDSSFLVSIYARGGVNTCSSGDDWLDRNASCLTFEALFAYADPLKLWRFFSNCTSGC